MKWRGFNMDPNVSIIIVNWNGWKESIECLESIYQINYPNYNVILVDNNSEDDSIDKIKEYCKGKIQIKSKFIEYNKNNKPLTIIEYSEKEINNENHEETVPAKKNLILIKNDSNYGFAKGNNIAIKYSMKNLNPDYILLLNNDTVVSPNFLTKLVNKAKSDDTIGVIGPKIYYYNYNGESNYIWFAGGRVNLRKYPGYFHLDEGIINSPIKLTGKCLECDWISGAAMMIKTDLLKKFLLDDKYFFGAEDVDLCIKIRREGYKIFCVLESIIWHKASVSKEKKYKGKKIKEMEELSLNNLKFLRSNSNTLFFVLILPIYIIQMSRIINHLKVIFER